MKRSNVYFDPKADVLYIVTRGGEEEATLEIAEGINVELDKDHEVIGIEILNASSALRPFIGKMTGQQLRRRPLKLHK